MWIFVKYFDFKNKNSKLENLSYKTGCIFLICTQHVNFNENLFIPEKKKLLKINIFMGKVIRKNRYKQGLAMMGIKILVKS